MEKKRGPGRPRTFQREDAVALAVDLYWKDGLHGLWVNEVCRRMGLSKPALYREFGGEDGLLDAALESYWANVLAPALEALDPAEPFVRNTEFIVDVVGSADQGCLLVKMRDARERLGPRSGIRVDSAIRKVRKSYEKVIKSCARRNEVRSDVSPRRAAHYIDAQVTNGLRQMANGEKRSVVVQEVNLALSALLPT